MQPRRITMEARNPERNVRRQWQLEVHRDLFGGWMVDITFGRIGAAGRTLHRYFEDPDEARRYVRAALSRRRGAPRRIGVPYVTLQDSEAQPDNAAPAE